MLEVLSAHTAAMTGAQTDRMTRDDGWRLLSTGRHLERLGFLAQALHCAFESGAAFDEGGFEAVVALFDSTITFHAQYQQRHDIPALLDLLVLDRDNPRSLSWVAQTLRGRLAKLAGTPAGVMPVMAMVVPDPKAVEAGSAMPARRRRRLRRLAGHAAAMRRRVVSTVRRPHRALLRPYRRRPLLGREPEASTSCRGAAL